MSAERRVTGCAEVVVSSLVMLSALFAGSGPGDGGGAARVYDVKWLSLNRWRLPFYNDGRFGLDVSGGSDRGGGTWPQPYSNQYLYGAGLWFGSVSRSPADTARRDTLVSFGYNPNNHATEMTPGSAANWYLGGTSGNDRIFVYPGDWPPRPRDWFVTSPGLESLVPDEARSLGDLWCAYTDAVEDNHAAPGRPQQIDVYQSVYAWNVRLSQDMFFVSYQFRNAGTDTLRRCFAGVVLDPDVGSPGDDMVKLLLDESIPGAPRVRNVALCGDNDNAENPGRLWESGTPGAMVCKLLASPAGLTALKRFGRATDPLTDRNQYLTMAGYDYRTGIFVPYDSAPDAEFDDKRFILASGPFDLAPGQVEQMVIAGFVAPYGGPGQRWDLRPRDSLVHVARSAASAQFVYDAGWVLAGPPHVPNVTLVPGDNQVRIVWDDVSEREPDRYWERVAGNPENPAYDPMYRGHDFEGYVVYKSRDAAHWQILGQFDLPDSIRFEYPSNGDSSVADSLWIRATDNGVRRSLVDTDVRNGFRYYYYVAAYDWNYQTTEWDSLHQRPVKWDTLVFVTGPRADLVAVPRWDAADFVLPLARVDKVIGDTANPALSCSVATVVPFRVERETCELRFAGPVWTGSPAKAGYRYVVVAGGAALVETTGFEHRMQAGSTTGSDVPVFNGLQLRLGVDMAPPAAGFDAARTGDRYPSESLRLAVPAPSQAWWAFRGSDFRLVWRNRSGRLTADVADATNGGVPLPFARFTTTDSGPRNADGWCFVNRAFRGPADTLTPAAAYMYVGGGYFGFRRSGDSLGQMLGRIEDGDTWLLTGHRAEGSAPFHNVYRIIAGRGSSAEPRAPLQVRVVPNPYVMFDEWESSTWQRQVRFTRLPSRCTIRVYTVSGDLVRVLEHTDTRSQPQDQGGTELWDLTSDGHLVITSGVYVFHVQSDVGECAGRLAVIR